MRWPHRDTNPRRYFAWHPLAVRHRGLNLWVWLEPVYKSYYRGRAYYWLPEEIETDGK